MEDNPSSEDWVARTAAYDARQYRAARAARPQARKREQERKARAKRIRELKAELAGVMTARDRKRFDGTVLDTIRDLQRRDATVPAQKVAEMIAEGYERHARKNREEEAERIVAELRRLKDRRIGSFWALYIYDTWVSRTKAAIKRLERDGLIVTTVRQEYDKQTTARSSWHFGGAGMSVRKRMYVEAL